ncbi:MAG: DUF86 domain-containing protein [Melioribacteraceae bacterium]
MLRGDKELLIDILEAIRRIESYVEGINYNQFLSDLKTQDSVVRNLEIIGEAVRKVSDEIKNKNALVEWRNIANLRNRLIHDYFGINLDIVWGILEEDLEHFKTQMRTILETL